MRLLTVVIVALGALWGGYWFVGARALDRAVTAGLGDLSAQGVGAVFSDVVVNGFPNRFDLTISDIALTDPRSGIGWSAPFVQALALSYKPYHIIAVWPDSQTVTTRDQTVTLTSSGMRGSVVFQPDTALPLDRTSIIIDAGELASDAGWRAGFAQARFATERSDDGNRQHHLGLELTDLRLDPALKDVLDPDGTLPAAIARLHLDAQLGFDRPLDRFAASDSGPQLTDIALTDARMVWGEAVASADGALTFDAAGRPSGDITIRLTQWRQILPFIFVLLQVDQQQEPLVVLAMEALEGMSENPEQLEVPLKVTDGIVTLGGIPVWQVP